MDGITKLRPRHRAWLTVAAAALLLTLVGCGKNGTPDAGDTGTDDDTADAGPVELTDLQAVPNPSNALSYYVDWSSNQPVRTDLTVDCGDWKQRYGDGKKRTDHRVFVMGLWEGATCDLTAWARTAGGDDVTASTTVDVGPLPDYLPDLQVRNRVESKIQSGWTMFNLSNRKDGIPLTVGMVDSRGRFRWYHQLSVSFSGSDTEVYPMEDSILVGKTRNGPREIDWQGDVVWKAGFSTHHEIRPANGGDWIHVLRNANNCSQRVGSGGVFRYSRTDEQFVGTWHLCDYWYPPQGAPLHDWSHLNTIEKVPGEKAWIISSRTQHSLFKIDYGDDKLDWKMGHRGDFGLSGSQKFYRQHAPEVLSNGNILLFDNGSKNHNRPYSRALEISYDTSDMTAEIAWKYRPDPDVYAKIWGDADRLSNGNTLVTFGLRNDDPNRNSHLMEVTKNKQRVWHLEAPNKWGWYRSDRITELPTGSVQTDGD